MPPKVQVYVRVRRGVYWQVRWYAAVLCAWLGWERGMRWCIAGVLEVVS